MILDTIRKLGRTVDFDDTLASDSPERIDPEFAERDSLDDDLRKKLVSDWRKRLQAEAKAHRKFRDEAKIASDHYHNEAKTKEKENTYPAYYSAVQVQLAVLYGGDPVPDVRRRFADSELGDKNVALCLERALSYFLDCSDAYSDLGDTVEDLSVAGLGVTVVTRERQQDGSFKVGLERWPWSAYRWEPAGQYRDVDWIGLDRWLTPAEIRKQFHVDETHVKAQGNSELPPVDGSETPEEGEKIRVTLVYHKPSRKVLVVGEGYDTLLDYYSDPYGLHDFFPCARPMMQGVRSGALIPRPEMMQFRHIINKIHRYTTRIDKLERSIRDVTFYDSALGDVFSKIQGAGDGTFIPLDSILEKLMSAGGAALNLNHVIAALPMGDRMALMESLSAERDKLKAELEHAMGIADIMAGMSNPNEAAETQHLKSDWGSARMRRKRQIVNGHIRETLRIMADMITTLPPEQLYAISGVELDQNQLAMLTDDTMRTYAVDIETDSTAIQTRYRDQAARAEVVRAIADVAGNLAPMVQQGALPSTVYQEVMTLAVRGIPAGRSLEDSLGTLAQYTDAYGQMQQQMGQMQQDLEALTQERDQYMQAFGEAQARLDERSEAEQAEDLASVQDKLASAEKKRAEADKTRSDTVIQNAGQVVPLGSSVDELTEGRAWRAGWEE